MFSGGMEWVVIGLVVLLLFGGKKIPELAKGLGSGIRNFKKAVNEEDNPVEISQNNTESEVKNSTVQAEKTEA